MVERWFESPEVVGSSPIAGTKFNEVAMRIAYRPFMKNTVAWEDIKGNSIEAAKAWVRNDLWVGDTDSSGDETEHFAIKLADEYRYFVVRHEWYWSDWDSVNRHVANTFKFKEVTKEEAKIGDDRDWMDLRPRGYPENLNWPPKA